MFTLIGLYVASFPTQIVERSSEYKSNCDPLSTVNLISESSLAGLELKISLIAVILTRAPSVILKSLATNTPEVDAVMIEVHLLLDFQFKSPVIVTLLSLALTIPRCALF